MIRRIIFYKNDVTSEIWTIFFKEKNKDSEGDIFNVFSSIAKMCNDINVSTEKAKAQLILALAIKGYKIVDTKPEQYLAKILEDHGTLEDTVEYIIKA